MNKEKLLLSVITIYSLFEGRQKNICTIKMTYPKLGVGLSSIPHIMLIQSWLHEQRRVSEIVVNEMETT